MLQNVKNGLKKYLQTITSSHCILCEAQHNDIKNLLCKACRKSLPYISHYCQQCGNILASHTPYSCHFCLKNPIIFDDAFSLFHYKPPIDYFIKQLKFQQQLVYAHLLGNNMVDALIEHTKQTKVPLTTPDAIFPVPLHPKRIRSRGFNQTLEIARPIAKKLNIPLITNTLTRSHYTQAQTKVNVVARRSNIKNSFRYQPNTPYKTIAIVDDVMTTGSTLHEITKTLKQHTSVENVYVWICACAKNVYYD